MTQHLLQFHQRNTGEITVTRPTFAELVKFNIEPAAFRQPLEPSQQVPVRVVLGVAEQEPLRP